MNKILSFFTLLLFLTSCGSDDNLHEENSKGVIKVEYHGKNVIFNNVKVGKITNENGEVIGKFFNSDNSNLDNENEKYRIFFLFDFTDENKNDFKFYSTEFISYEKSKNGGVGLDGTSYQYEIEGFPFEISNLLYERDSLKGNFNGYLFYTNSLKDTITASPAYLKNGYFNVKMN